MKYIRFTISVFNTNAIVYDNTPWRPGRDTDTEFSNKPIQEEDERKLKNLATRILSNGVEVLVKDKSSERKPEQRKSKLIHLPTKKSNRHVNSSPSKLLLTSAIATVTNERHISAVFPLNRLMQRNYIIKTCLTTYTYLTTVIQNKRSAVSTFETIVSVVTTESLTGLYASDLIADIYPTKTKHTGVKTITPSSPNTKLFSRSSLTKINKRVDGEVGEDLNENFELIQPSEVNHISCSTSCSCSNTETESLTKLKTRNEPIVSVSLNKIHTKNNLHKTVESVTVHITEKNNYKYQSHTKLAPTDKIVEKYTEVMNDYSEEKNPSSAEATELLTNEQAPEKTDKLGSNQGPEKNVPVKHNKPNKNKVVADLIKLGSLSIKGLTQLRPVLEKMTEGFIKKPEKNRTSTTTTVKPATKIIPYNLNKRVDSEVQSKQSNFPIYIPVDELETAESQFSFNNVTLHQNLAWLTEKKHPKAHIAPPKIVHESPLVNGGIPISPGEIITANSDVIVGKPAVGGPLTLATSGIILQNALNLKNHDSYTSSSEQFLVKENSDKINFNFNKVDDSYDLRPPEPPKSKQKLPNRNLSKPHSSPVKIQGSTLKLPQNIIYPHPNKNKSRMPPLLFQHEQSLNSENLKSTNTIIGLHGRPAFLDYIPSFKKPNENFESNSQLQSDKGDYAKGNSVILDSSPSSSEIINTRVKSQDDHSIPAFKDPIDKPFLVDIQPSRVANVLIPHGSSTALVFAGSSEPHKTGDYVDDPLPYPEPGYFGSFSIDAPQMTNIHNYTPTNIKQVSGTTTIQNTRDIVSSKEQEEERKDWKGNILKNSKIIPPPTSNQAAHIQIGPTITSYNPDIYSSSNTNTNKFNIRNPTGQSLHKVIDKEYENFLSVPPPPPKLLTNQDYFPQDKNKPYNNQPIVHTKPIQDMKVFLNVQHPVPNLQSNVPPKVTSEIYFAAQSPTGDKKTPVYTVHIPPVPVSNNNLYNNYVNNFKNNSLQLSTSQSSAPNRPSNNLDNNFGDSVSMNTNIKNKHSTYSVTLNTATNVANKAVNSAGSILPQNILTNYKEKENAEVPIKTNFAIKVDDSLGSLQKEPITQFIYDQHGEVNHGMKLNDNRWNATNVPAYPYANSELTKYTGNKVQKETKSPFKYAGEITSNVSFNSHANFPMINDLTTTANSGNVELVTENIIDASQIDIKRPAKLIPNIPTNSHGWYSSNPYKNIDFSNIKNINNVQVESTTRKIISLLYQYDTNNAPEFGHKLSTVGKPPTEILSTNIGHNVPVMLYPGKPFTKTEQINNLFNSSYPAKASNAYGFNYLPANFDNIEQPVYDIPTKESSDELTTKMSVTIKDKEKAVIENSEEIFDGEEGEKDDADGEVSLESMKVPIISSSDNKYGKQNSTYDFTLLQEEMLDKVNKKHYGEGEKDTPLLTFNPGSQTEKPFSTSFDNTRYHSNTIKPIIHNNYSNIKPRPFTMSAFNTTRHQLHKPHWQINELLQNATNVSSEDNIKLNIGEEIQTDYIEEYSSQSKNPIKNGINNKPKPLRPVFSVRPNNTLIQKEPNIITSTVYIQEKIPINVLNDKEKVAGSSATKNITFDIKKSSSEIIDLSPPPPTINLSFTTTSTGETIMGMNPPPPRPLASIPLKPAIPGIPPKQIYPPRIPSPYRPKPILTNPSKVSNTRPSPTRKPINKEEIHAFQQYETLPDKVKFNYDQPSTQLLPPPTEKLSQFVPSAKKTGAYGVQQTLMFPTSVSSSWLTSSGVDFSSSFNFAPTSVQFPEKVKSTSLFESQTDRVSTEENETYENYSSQNKNDGTVKTSTETVNMSPLNEKEISQHLYTNNTQNIEDEVTSKDRLNVIPLISKSRTRKPYPVRTEIKKLPINSKSSTSKYKLPTKPPSVIKPTRTISRSHILYPTKQSSIKNIRPMSTRKPITLHPSIIETSEFSLDDDFIKSTEVLQDSATRLPDKTIISGISESTIQNYVPEEVPTINSIHHGGNEIKIYDEIIPTRTEFKTTVITLTKTLSEPPQTISSIGYVNLTHTLTVTHTETSLISQPGEEVTQTLILTNTQTSTVVDVVTEIQTQILPTTIIETVTKHIAIPQVEATTVVHSPTKTKLALDDVTMSSEEDNFIIRDTETTENIQKIDKDEENDTFFVVMNKSQNGGSSPSINTMIDSSDNDEVTRNEQVNNNGVSQVLFGEILLAGTPYLETTNVNHPGFGKECQPDCKASRNERCQRIEGMMKCICRPGFARMFPDRPCKPTYTYSVKLALNKQGDKRLIYHEDLANNSSKDYTTLALATREGIKRMVMQTDLRDMFHGAHITGFQPVEMIGVDGESYQGVMNAFYVQLFDNANESKLKEVIEKYLRNKNYSLGGTDVYAAGELIDKIDVSDFDECTSKQFNDCSEHAQCFNMRGTYTCSCSEGFADLSVNSLYPGRICSAEPLGCELCNYHGSCYSRDDNRVLCECFQWYTGSTCHINLKVVLISVVTSGALLTAILVACAVVACSKRPRRQRSIVACIQGMPTLHQGPVPSKQRADRRALISERADSGDGSSLQNASLPYIPAKKTSAMSSNKKPITISDPPAHDPPPPPAPAVMIPRARLHQQHRDSKDNTSRKQSLELSSEAKLISYLEAGANVSSAANDEMMRRKYSEESSYSLSKERHPKQGALVSAGFKVSTTIRPEEHSKDIKDDESSIHKTDIDTELSRFDTLRKSYSNEDISEWTDAERRIGELTLSEARSIGGTLPASTGRPASSTRLTNQEANTMAERDLGSTFLLPHVHLYKPDVTSDVSEFDSL